jgi:hypothetical protein
VGARTLARCVTSRPSGGAPHAAPALAIVPLPTPFAVAFTAPPFRHALVLVCGTLLASGRRTVAAALRAVGLEEERRFSRYQRVLSRLLLGLLGRAFLAPDAPLELVVDGALERRRGRKLAWKGRFHDAVRSQPGHVVTSEGIHRLRVMLLVADGRAAIGHSDGARRALIRRHPALVILVRLITHQASK